MKRIFYAFVIALFAFSGPAMAKSFGEMFPQYVDRIAPKDMKLVEGLHFQQGKISVGDGIATLDVGEGYYYLGPKDARFVLTEIWGNPPDDSTLGLLLPADITPLHDDGWAVEISYDEIGHVSHEDAEGYDYDALLDTMRDDNKSANEWRTQYGYPELELMGWAEPPHYDKEGRKLFWAKDIRFKGSKEHTLNFNIRILGRKGVLVEKVIAGMNELDRVNRDLPDILAMTNFTDGNRYDDFKPSMDKVAAIGIGGLIAGKVVAKTGLIVFLLVLLKKAWIVLLLPFLWLKNKFGGRKSS